MIKKITGFMIQFLRILTQISLIQFIQLLIKVFGLFIYLVNWLIIFIFAILHIRFEQEPMEKDQKQMQLDDEAQVQNVKENNENLEQQDEDSSGSDLEKKSLNSDQDIEQEKIDVKQQKKIIQKKELQPENSVEQNQQSTNSKNIQVKMTQKTVSKQKPQGQSQVISNPLEQKIVNQEKEDQVEDSWDDDSKFSQDDQGQYGQKQKELKSQPQYFQTNGVSQYDIGVDYDQVRKYTEDQNYQSSMVLSGLQDTQQLKSFEHTVQKKYLLLLYLLFRKDIYDLCKGKNRIDLHPSNKGKITIFGKNQTQIKQLLKIVEDTVDKISIVKLQIRYDQAVKMKISRKLTAYLQAKKLIIFKYGQQGNKNYYIGGKGTQSNILQQFQLLKKLKYKYFRLFQYKSTRSYKVIFEQILNFPIIVKTFEKKWSLKYLELVDFIPNNNGPNKEMGYQFKKQKQNNICILMTSFSNEIISPKQIEVDLSSFIKTNFYCVTLIFNKSEQYLPKLKVEGVKFKIISQKKFKRSYLYIVCLRKDYELKIKEIIQAIDNMKQEIYGARFFNNLSPSFKQYLKPQQYKFKKYPQHNPYSNTLFAKKQFKFDWKEFMINISTVPIQQKQVEKKQ